MTLDELSQRMTAWEFGMRCALYAVEADEFKAQMKTKAPPPDPGAPSTARRRGRPPR